MADLLDELIARLKPSVLKKVEAGRVKDETNAGYFDKILQDSLREIDELEINRFLQFLGTETEMLHSKLSENKRLLERYQNELDRAQKFQKTVSSEREKQGLKAYSKNIHDLEGKLKALMIDSPDNEAALLFSEVETLWQSIQDLQKRCNEIQDALKIYDDLPPNLNEARRFVAEKQREIELKELKVEENFFNN